VKEEGSNLTIQFREVAIKNPHYPGPSRQPKGKPESWVPKGRLHYFLNGEKISESMISRKSQPEGRITCGFVLDKHRLVTMKLPANLLKYGENKLAVFMPGFPYEYEPYVYIYELTVSLKPEGKKN
jgi:hypothetical protein